MTEKDRDSDLNVLWTDEVISSTDLSSIPHTIEELDGVLTLTVDVKDIECLRITINLT